ncbi:uncharacterized protein [Coffea arabica]|uniref:ATP-dependent DNA helicase n=1 Tax=Coffea arabica TaxID=13443 RepID=A0ABM4WAV1_COFAR
MGRNRVYGSLEEARAEKNRRSREQRAAARRETKNDAPLGVCTLAVTAFNIHDSNAVNQPNMGVIESSLGSGSILPFAENNAEHLQAENQGDVSRSTGNGAREVPTTNSDAGESSLHRRRRRTRRSMTNPLNTIITEPAVLLSNAEQFPTENEENVCASIADGANEVSSTNLDVGEPSLRRQRRSRKPAITDPLATIATEPAVLPDVPSCPYCHAKRFHQEPPGFCCASGEVQLLSTEMPRELMLLYIEDSDEAAEFRRCVRSYNNMFAFTSIGIHPDKSLAANYNGVYTFRIQGQMYHYINPLIPENGEKPRNLQLYFVDTDHETTQRLSISSRFQETLVTKLEKILKINPYSAFFRGLQDLPGIDDYKIVLDTTPAVDQRVFNKPTVSQVGAVWTESTNSEHVNSKHIQIYGKNGQTQIVKHYFACHDSLQYPLIFANGEPGWHPGIEKIRHPNKSNITSVTCEGETIIATTTATMATDIIDAENRGRLLQQYVVDVYVKIESIRLDFHRGRSKQAQLRTEIYQGIVDSISSGESSSSSIGKRIFLPASFIGGPRDMRRRYMDAMSLVQRYGKPDIFLTMTCNKNWPEIKKMLLPTDKVENRPDLISRVFRAKLQQLKDELLKKNIFGKVAAYTYVIEFQKRGLPHAHFLIILKQGWKMYSPESYDRIVCAELPDARQHPYLYELVVKHMMHGPCGAMNPSCPCMKQHIGCKDNYPKEFTEATRHSHNSYPVYRRRDFQQSVTVRGHPLDNRWVIPYNPYLLSKFNCHINVEICSTIRAVKYIYKYIYKGHDKILYQLTNTGPNEIVDEIKNFVCARWVSPPEAMWRIYAFDLNEVHPSVISLQLHLENKQSVTFDENQSLQNVISNPCSSQTMLTEFFSMNCYDEYAKHLNCLYIEFPEYFTWNAQSKYWSRRKRGEVIGRILTARPTEGERYYLRMLLMHVRKPTSFQDLKVVNGYVCQTFKEAANLLGLLHSDNAAELCLQEASAYQMPSSLRQLFASILAYCTPTNPRELWLKYEDFLSEDIRHTIRSKGCIALATATSGVAASILPGGRTAHSRFKIPLQDSDTAICNIGKQSAIAKLIRDAKVIIWDEASMAKRSSIEKFDESLKDIMNKDAIFGGKIIVFGGDFRQTLPVITKGCKEEIVNASLVKSPIWPYLIKLKLSQNMRA